MKRFGCLQLFMPEEVAAESWKKGFFSVEREVNSGWPALKETRWKGKSKSCARIFRKTFNQHFGDTHII
jgi:hypothetical protein